VRVTDGIPTVSSDSVPVEDTDDTGSLDVVRATLVAGSFDQHHERESVAVQHTDESAFNERGATDQSTAVIFTRDKQ
jgi:outer membrane scaffolding protein for murein synthesis (MipA/OmpV family)